MKKQLIHISVLQSSKIITALYALMGFIYTLVGIPMIIFGSDQIRIIGIVYLFMPIIMGICGFVFFVLFAAIYNLLAKSLGGFEFEIKNMDLRPAEELLTASDVGQERRRGGAVNRIGDIQDTHAELHR